MSRKIKYITNLKKIKNKKSFVFFHTSGAAVICPRLKENLKKKNGATINQPKKKQKNKNLLFEQHTCDYLNTYFIYQNR